MDEKIAKTLDRMKMRDPHEKEFIQAFSEILFSLRPVFEKEPALLDIFERIAEPERVSSFRVCWTDEFGEIHINRGWRVQMSSALGPYKGGLRFHSTVNTSIMKFLALEQTFKNALTSMPLGGAKGGSDFNPRGRSDRDIMAFCQAFLTSLWHHIGVDIDVPAGDLGVGTREIGYLIGQYERLSQQKAFKAFTGKPLCLGGSLLRQEATGWGIVYFADEIMKSSGQSLSSQRCLISGSGNVAQNCAKKLLEMNAIPLTLSDSDGCIFDPSGFTKEKLDIICYIKNIQRGRIQEYTNYVESSTYYSGTKPWTLAVTASIAFPCATQNEIEMEDAERLFENGVRTIVEGSNMSTITEAIHYFKRNAITFAPSKASNLGGVVVSGLEMAQNSSGLKWTSEQVDGHLHDIIRSVYKKVLAAAEEYGNPGDLQVGANVASFLALTSAVSMLGTL